jgi:hypothetical protein
MKVVVFSMGLEGQMGVKHEQSRSIPKVGTSVATQM